jgi:methylmalonyl-CoA mutase
VLVEFDRINARGGVLGAMETGYQRGRIQDESMLYEHKKHDGSLPIVGVNTFRRPDADGGTPTSPELARATDAEKQSQLDRLADFHSRHREQAPAALARLQADGDQRRQRLRRPHGRRPRLLARADQRRLLRGRGQYRRNV